MKKRLTAITVFSLGGLAVSTALADPAPSCARLNEQLRLEPAMARYNSHPGTPTASGSALYSTDAGVQFFVGSSLELDAVPVASSTTCPAATEQVTATVVDPWTGERVTLSLGGTR